MVRSVPCRLAFFGVTDVSLTCLAARNPNTRGEMAMFTSPVTRLPGPALGSLPPLKHQNGRLRVRMIRKLSRQICGPIWFPYCVRGALCTRNCNLVTQVMRDRVRGHFDCIRAEVCSYLLFFFIMSSWIYLFICLSYVSFQVAVGARHRAMSFLFTLMMREWVVRNAHYRMRTLTQGRKNMDRILSKDVHTALVTLGRSGILHNHISTGSAEDGENSVMIWSASSGKYYPSPIVLTLRIREG